MTVEVLLRTEEMRRAMQPPALLSRGSTRELYWTAAQMLAHASSNGCALEPGDLLATGTISGPDRTSAGCLLELTRNGAEPVTLADGETRRWLEDGDEVVLEARCARPGFPTLTLGRCVGTIAPALARFFAR